MTVSAFDHPVLGGLLGDDEAAGFFAIGAEMQAMLDFEAGLARAEAAEGVIPPEAGEAIARAIAGFTPDMAGLRAGTARDGVVVPELVKQLRAAVGEPHGASVHFGATSQDAIDTGLALRLSGVMPILGRRVGEVVAVLSAIEARDGAVRTMGHTRMQAAIAVPASRKIASWRDPLQRHLDRLDAVRDEVAILHFGGAAGTLEKLGDRADAVTGRLAGLLSLRAVARPRHSERDGVAGFASWLSLVTGSLGKMGQDIALMAQSEVGEIRLASGGGSSAMPHKVNPVGAETLVALARFNATLVSGMHHAMVHENERSGAAWMLEWLVLPQMTVAAAASLRCAAGLLAGLSFAGGR